MFLSLADLRSIEGYALNHNYDLIEKAAAAVLHFVKEHFNTKTRILILVGRGNNGSDGLASGVLLHDAGFKVDYIRIFKDNGASNELWFSKLHEFKNPLSRMPSDFNKYGLIIDAIYGIGLMHELDVDTSRIIERINRSSAYILALDAPSGLNPFSAKVYGSAVNADTTLSFIADKPGLHTADGLDHSGEVQIAQLIDYQTIELTKPHLKLQFNLLNDINYQTLIRVKLNCNKGSFGTVAIIGGNKGMHGALHLAGRAALLCGAGRVSLSSMDSKFNPSLVTSELTMMLPKDIVKNLQAFDAIAIGPGLGQDEKAYKILARLLSDIEDTKLVLDADALNLIAANHDLKLKLREVRYKIITPHPGEAARLLGLTVNEVQDDRFFSISELSEKLMSISLLKGAGSLIQAQGTIYINQTGNPSLANAGQGDVLTGILLSFLAQGMNMSDSIRLASYIHGLAADHLVVERRGYHGILAGDIANKASELLNELLYSRFFND